MRRLTALTCSMVAVDTLFYSAIGPLLPLLARSHGLSEAQLGLVSGAFGAGAIAGAVLSAYLVGRFGVRPVAVVGLLVLAGSSLAFGLADGFGALALARLGAGASSALSWGAAFAWLVLATPLDRRGRAIGTLFGTSVVGAAAGPALGSLAATVGVGVVFTAVAGLAVLIGLWALAEPAAAPGPSANELTLATARTIFRPTLLWGLGVVALGVTLFAALVVLAPLALDRLGWGARAVGAVFLLAALAEAAVHPAVGRWSDASGPGAPVRAGLAASVVLLLALAMAGGSPWLLAPLVVLAAACFNATVTPGAALFSGRASLAGVGPGVAFGAVNFAWSVGYALGASLAGALAEAFGDRAAYLALGAVCVLALLVTRRTPYLSAPSAPAPEVAPDQG